MKRIIFFALFFLTALTLVAQQKPTRNIGREQTVPLSTAAGVPVIVDSSGKKVGRLVNPAEIATSAQMSLKASTTDLGNLNLQLRSDLATKSALIDSIKSFVVAFHYAGFTPNTPISVDYSGMKNGWHAIHFSNTAYGVTYDANSQATVPVVSSYYDATTNTYTNAGFSTTSIRDNNILMAKVENGAMVAWYTIAPNSRLSVEVAALKTLMGSKASASDLSAEAAARVAGDAGKADTSTVLWQKMNDGYKEYFILKDSFKTVKAYNYTSQVIQTRVYVDPNGNDNNDGLSSAKPVKTLEKAFDLVNMYQSNFAYIFVQNTSALNPVILNANTYAQNLKPVYLYAQNQYITLKSIMNVSARLDVRGTADLSIDSSIQVGFRVNYGSALQFYGTINFRKNNQALAMSDQNAAGQSGTTNLILRGGVMNVNDNGFTGLQYVLPNTTNPSLNEWNLFLTYSDLNPNVGVKYINKIFYANPAAGVDNSYSLFNRKNMYILPIDYNTNNSANYNIRSLTDKGYVDSVSRVKSKTLTLPNNADFSIDLENGIQVTTLLDFTSGNIVTPPTINATFSNIRDGGIYRVRLTGTYNTGYIVFPSNVYKKDGTQFGTYTCLPETLVFHAEGTNLICDNK